MRREKREERREKREERRDDDDELVIAPRALATSGRRPGVRAKRAARGVAGRHLWTGRREKTGHPFTAIG